MKEAALVVTHGGHGTVMRGVVNRVPMLVIPHGRDQNDNAVRISHRKAGITLMPNAAVKEIHEACAALLSDPTYRMNAKILGDAVVREAETSTLVEQLESLTVAPGVRAA
jgi:UDP:flavonoid glycosyltransferase YjiC (YdhE family)